MCEADGAIEAHGYGGVAQHRESIFIDAGMVRDFTAQGGGRIDRCSLQQRCARIEIVLASAAAVARWLADS
jgi:hypothetical protein